METIRESIIEMLSMKNIIMKIKDVFDGYINRVNKGKKRMSKLANRLIEITQARIVREKKE